MLDVDGDIAAPGPIAAEIFITFAAAAEPVGENNDRPWAAALAGAVDFHGHVAMPGVVVQGLAQNGDLLAGLGRLIARERRGGEAEKKEEKGAHIQYSRRHMRSQGYRLMLPDGGWFVSMSRI